MNRTLLLLCLALLGQSAAAQTAADTTVALPELTVTATRIPMPAAEAPLRVTVLDADDIGATGARSVGGLLDARSPLFVRSYGGGGLATPSLRGSGASQTLVLLDGHRIADPQSAQVDLSLLPTLLLSSVEVTGGAGSPLYGTDAMGGVIDMRTLSPAAGTVVKVRGGGGAYGGRSGGALLGGSRGRVSGLLLTDWRASDGNYPYLDGGLTPPEDVRRTGADVRHTSVYTSARYTTGRGYFRVAGWYADADRGLPTIVGSQSAGERQWDRSLRVWADGERKSGRVTYRVGGLVQDASLRYVSRQFEIDETGRTLVASLDLEARADIDRHWLLGGGLSGGLGRARHPGLVDDADDRNLGAYVHGTGSYGPLAVYPALRLDGYSTSGAGATWTANPRLGLNLRLPTVPRMHLKASAGRSFRVPSLNDRFWQPGGNPDLRPEHGWSADLGLYAEVLRGRLETTAYRSRVRDQIVWLPTSDWWYAPENRDRVDTRGLEASYRGRWVVVRGAVLDAGVFYTYTDARDRSDPESTSFDMPLRLVPRHQVKGHLGIRMGPAEFDLAARHIGRRNVVVDGTRSLDPALLLDGQVRLDGTLGNVAAELAVVLENLTDRRYQVMPANPMPPRHLRIQLTLAFGPRSGS